MMYRRSLGLSVLLALGAGCASSDLDVLCAAGDGVWTLQKVVAEKCTGTSTRAVFTSSYMEDKCRGTLTPLFDSGTATIASDEVIESCREALKVTPCEPDLYKDWVNATAICNDIVVGKTATGGSCSVDDECGGASFCKRTATCGSCTGQGGNGAPCTSDTECQSNLCAGGVCVIGAVAEEGQCTNDNQCGEGLICRMGSCQPLEGHIGTVCQSDADCAAHESSCANGVCTLLAKISEPCTPWTGGDGSAPHCMWFAGAGCRVAERTCQGLPVSAEGGPCGLDTGTCASDLWCSAGQCYPITDEGGACTMSAQCGPYAVCTENVCTFSSFAATCAAPS